VFVIEQALSVRALQELVTAAGSETVSLNLSVQQTKEESTDYFKRLRLLHMGISCCQICCKQIIIFLRLYLDKEKFTQPIITYFFDISGCTYD
jgi:hypothetical protein